MFSHKPKILKLIFLQKKFKYAIYEKTVLKFTAGYTPLI